MSLAPWPRVALSAEPSPSNSSKVGHCKGSYRLSDTRFYSPGIPLNNPYSDPLYNPLYSLDYGSYKGYTELRSQGLGLEVGLSFHGRIRAKLTFSSSRYNGASWGVPRVDYSIGQGSSTSWLYSY